MEPLVHTHFGGTMTQCFGAPFAQSFTVTAAFAPENRANVNSTIAIQKISGWPGRNSFATARSLNELGPVANHCSAICGAR